MYIYILKFLKNTIYNSSPKFEILTKDVKDLNTKNYITLLKKLEKT